MADTVGERIAEIRGALGLTQPEFAARLTQVSGRRYSAPEVSRMENGKENVTLEDIDTIARVDPAQRGREWLGWGGPLVYEAQRPTTSFVPTSKYAGAPKTETPAAKRRKGA